MGPRDVMMLYTDGLTEAADARDEEYGEARLKSSALSHRLRPLDEMARRIAEDLDRFTDGVPYGDDRTLVLLRRTAETTPDGRS